MDERTVPPWVRPALEFGPVILFLIGYIRVRNMTVTLWGVEYEGLILAAAGLVPLLLVSNFLLWQFTGRLSRIQVFTLVMVVITTGLTVWFNDDQFYKMKTTLVYGTYASLLGIGLLRGQSYLEYAVGEHIQFEHEGWMILTRRIALAYLVLAVLNEIIWRNFSDDVWVPAETVGFPVAFAALLMWQFHALQHFMISDEAPAQDDDEAGV